MCKEYNFRFLFDEKVLLSSYVNFIRLNYQIDDDFYFLSFSPATKEFEEWFGFGENRKSSHPKWWKDTRYGWKELS